MSKEEAKKSLQDTKVYVAGKSAQIQEILFELGFVWRDGERQPQFTDFPFLYIESGIICGGSDMDYFGDSPKKEVTADYILDLTWDRYDFEPFEKVLVRDNDNRNWRATLYSHKEGGIGFMTIDSCWQQCIPYMGNEELLGTNNKPKRS